MLTLDASKMWTPDSCKINGWTLRGMQRTLSFSDSIALIWLQVLYIKHHIDRYYWCDTRSATGVLSNVCSVLSSLSCLDISIYRKLTLREGPVMHKLIWMLWWKTCQSLWQSECTISLTAVCIHATASVHIVTGM